MRFRLQRSDQTSRAGKFYSAFPVLFVSGVFLHFSAEAAIAQQAVLYDFTATWCGPCQQVSPIVHKLQREGLPIQQVDIDKNPKLAQKFRVSSIPAFVLVVNGKEVKRVLGGQTTEQDLRELLAKIPAQQPARQNTATASLSQGNRRSSPRTSPRRNNTGYETPVLGNATSFPASFAAQQQRPAQQRPAQQKRPQQQRPAQQQQYAQTRQAAPAMPTASSRTAPKENAFASLLNNRRNGSGTNPQVSSQATDSSPIIRAQIDKSSNVTKPIPHIDSSAANVRIRIKDEAGINYGSGTVIQSQPGISYVLTCGHIFRKLTESSKVDVDIFTGDRFESFVGKVEKYDLDADVGLISIPTDGVLPVARLAVLGTEAPKGETVISVGCSGGQPPTVQQLAITALNRYTGPDNIECTGVPVQGRSGGGLFNLENEVVGVCIAADPKEKRGLYAGLKPILELVTSCGLDNVVRTAPVIENAFASHNRAMPEPPEAFPATAGNSVFANQSSGQLQNQGNRTSDPQAVANHLRHLQLATGSKLTIVIEDPNTPGQTRVVIIPSATPRLIADLTGELSPSQKVSTHRRMISQNKPVPTSAHSLQKNIWANRNPSATPIRNVSREEDRSLTMPTDFSVAQPYRRMRK